MDINYSVSRPEKFSHLDTIIYELDMLDYSLERLKRGNFDDNKDYYLCIECFLLHYRNVCDFFGNRHDLKAGEPNIWCFTKKLSDSEVASIQDKKPYDEHSGQISQYLSHCTKSRANDRDWKPFKMYAQLKPCMDNFRRLFPTTVCPPQTATGWIGESMSTCSVSYPAASLIDELSPHLDPPQRKKK
jgi:hypothetical protein